MPNAHTLCLLNMLQSCLLANNFTTYVNNFPPNFSRTILKLFLKTMIFVTSHYVNMKLFTEKQTPKNTDSELDIQRGLQIVLAEMRGTGWGVESKQGRT